MSATTFYLAGLLLVAPGTAKAVAPDSATAVFAGGCFWGVELVFEHLRGVTSATAGYADGFIEAVRVAYDPSRITYRDLVGVFFRVAHDPTQRDRQGPDAGPEYRAVAYYSDAGQRRTIADYLAELQRTRVYAKPIVTEVQPLRDFRVAEPYHQDYAARHPNDPYIVVNDAPKLVRLRAAFHQLYRERAQDQPDRQQAGQVLDYRLRLVDLRLFPDTVYGLQLVVTPSSSVAADGKGPGAVWLRFDPDTVLDWVNSAAAALRSAGSGGPAEAIQWSPTLRPVDGRGGLLVGRHRKKGTLQKDYWLAIADSAPGWQVEIAGAEADSLLKLFFMLSPRARVDSLSGAPDKEHVDLPAIMKSGKPRGLSGRFAAQFVVGIDGRIEEGSLLILLAAPARLEGPAREFIRECRFDPAQRGGRPVRQLVQHVFLWP